MAERLLLRPSEVAQALSLGRAKTYDMIQKGQIPSIRFGRSVRVRVDALAAWIDQHAIPEADEGGEATAAKT
jgi:excisionase family DNA binding protein